MKVAAIICEYNPFHNGHKFHIEETKRQTGADAVVLIMSGNFVQRGDVSIFDKALRAKAAIGGGADLVIELPAMWSSASAEFFAKGAVCIADSLGIVDFLSFGTEATDTQPIAELAGFLANEQPEFTDLLQSYISKGLSFPAARQKTVEDIMGTTFSELLSSPNNILGVEYCKALIALKSQIKPFAVARKDVNHDSSAVIRNTASASYIREQIINKNEYSPFVPVPSYNIYKNAVFHSLKNIEAAIICDLIKMPLCKLKDIADVSEGLENRIKAAALESKTLDELIDKIKTKRYTRSRIRRIILSSYLGITKTDRLGLPEYIKILDHNETGQRLIAAAKKTSSLPIVRNTSQINKLKNTEIKEAWEREKMFDALYLRTEFQL